MSRMDNRDLETFKKDIKFSTLLEKFWMDSLVTTIKKDPLVIKAEYFNNGIDNSGEYVEKSNRNADYNLLVATLSGDIYNTLEVKFAPTKGKITFKYNDLKDYVKQKAYIYLIYNDGSISLKKPKDYNVDKHIQMILNHINYVKYTMLPPDKIDYFIKYNDPVKIPYMGFKMGYILTPKEVEDWFGINWSKYEL